MRCTIAVVALKITRLLYKSCGLNKILSRVKNLRITIATFTNLFASMVESILYANDVKFDLKVGNVLV